MQVECLPPDRISNLPSSMIQTILSLVPIRDAFRTSILSRSWRYCCLKVPKLEFDDKLFQGTTNSQLTIKCKLLHAIYTVLLLHHGPVLEFSLCSSQLQSCSVIDQIILYLAKNTTVEKFSLCVSSYTYHIPSSFLSLQKLTHLKLQNCAIQPISTIFSFGRLISLCFHNVSITISTLLRFLCGCPLLKSFTLIGVEQHFTGSGYSDFVELFQCIPLLEYLRMSCCPVRHFASGVIPLKLPNALLYLKVLDLSGLSFAKEDELRSALVMVTSSPNIEKIKMEMYYNSTEVVTDAAMNLFDLQDYSYVNLDHLRELEITNFCNKKPGMDLVKLILGKSQMLKRVRVVINNQIAVSVEVKMQRDLLACLRASTRAQVIFERP